MSASKNPLFPGATLAPGKTPAKIHGHCYRLLLTLLDNVLQEKIKQLRRILVLWRLTFYRTKPGNLLPIDGAARDFLYALLAAEGYYQGPREGWSDEAQEGFTRLCLTENFDERISPPGMIDQEVLDYLMSIKKL